MKRFISIVLSILILTGIPFCAVGAEMSPILTKPTVFLSGDAQYNIVWATTDSGAAFVEIKRSGKTYLFNDEYDGLIRTDDYIHTVRVPKALLDSAGGYTIISRSVSSSTKNGISYENEVRENYTFKGDKGKNSISLAFFSDLHLKPAEFERVDMALDIMAEKMGAVDVIVLNGDITDALPNDMYFAETLLEGAHRLSGGSIPVIYARGNHEARGEYAQFIDRYLAFDSGNMYGTVSFGPMSAIVADCGEDKPDYQVEYGGLVDFDNYLTEQYAWLEGMGGYDSSRPYRVAISHSPKVFDRMYSEQCLDILEDYGTDILIGGHYHTAQMYTSADFPIATDGGMTSAGYRAGVLKLSGDSLYFEVWDEKLSSQLLYNSTVKSKELTERTEQSGEYVQNAPLLPIVKTSGITSTKGSDYSPTVTVAPTVFDCGDSYSIVYATDSGSNLTKAQAVVTTADGKEYTFTDAKAGNAVSDPLHSITVPKALLDGGSYVLKTTYLGAYGAYGENYTYEGISTDIGLTITSRRYTFNKPSGKDLAVACFSGGVAADIKNSMTDEPDVIVLTDMAKGLYTKRDFIDSILMFASSMSGGQKPVILCRGEGECYGDFAPYLSQYLRGESFFATSYGDINLIVCDTADTLLSKVHIQRQAQWLSELKLDGKAFSYFVGADADKVRSITAGVYDLLGGTAIISRAQSGYGTFTVFENDLLTQKQSSIFGFKEAPIVSVSASVSADRISDKQTVVADYMTSELKVAPESYDEAVVEKPSDLAWHKQMIYTWYEHGLPSTLEKGQVSAMQSTHFLVMYCNLLGIDYQKIEGDSRQLKAVKFAHSVGFISYEPPIMYTFSKDEIEGILKGFNI